MYNSALHTPPVGLFPCLCSIDGHHGTCVCVAAWRPRPGGSGGCAQCVRGSVCVCVFVCVGKCSSVPCTCPCVRGPTHHQWGCVGAALLYGGRGAHTRDCVATVVRVGRKASCHVHESIEGTGGCVVVTWCPVTSSPVPDCAGPCGWVCTHTYVQKARFCGCLYIGHFPRGHLCACVCECASECECEKVSVSVCVNVCACVQVTRVRVTQHS